MMISEQQRETGVVKWFDNTKGFGFIQRQQGADLFVHFKSIRGDGFRRLREGQQVQFSVAQKARGVQADDVVVEGAGARGQGKVFP